MTPLAKREILLIVCTILYAKICEAFLLQSPRLTNWGEWGTMDKCPPGQFVIGMQLKIETDQGLTKDDTALNAIKFFCGTLNSNPSMDNTITSSIGPWGFWRSLSFCASDFTLDESVESAHTLFQKAVAVGFQLRSEGVRGSRDDTAANNLILICANMNPESGEFQNIEKIQGDGTSWGSWTEEQMCPPQHAICGLSTQIELSKGRRHDDTALNNLNVECCRIELNITNNPNTIIFVNTTTVTSLAVEEDAMDENTPSVRDYEAERFPVQEKENPYNVTSKTNSNISATDKSTSEIISDWFGSKNITLPTLPIAFSNPQEDYTTRSSLNPPLVTEGPQTSFEERNTISNILEDLSHLSSKVPSTSVNNNREWSLSSESSQSSSTVAPPLESDDDYDDVEEYEIIVATPVSTMWPKMTEESLREFPETKQQYDSEYDYSKDPSKSSSTYLANDNRIKILLFCISGYISFNFAVL